MHNIDVQNLCIFGTQNFAKILTAKRTKVIYFSFFSEEFADFCQFRLVALFIQVAESGSEFAFQIQILT